MDVVRAIESAKVDRQDRPVDDIRILNVDVRQQQEEGEGAALEDGAAAGR